MSWPIESLTIHRFRGIEDLTMAGMGMINLLVGDNNSGKTSVLEAIAVYCQPLDSFAWLRTARRRVAGFATVSRSEAVKWLFPQGKQASNDTADLFSGDVTISGRGQSGERHFDGHLQEFETMDDALNQRRLPSGEAVRAEGEPVRGVRMDLRLTTDGVLLQHSIEILDLLLARRERRFREGSLPIEIISPFDHSIEDMYLSRFRRALDEEYKDSVVSLLKRVDPRIQDLEILPTARLRSALYIRHARSGRTPLSAFGDGVRRVLLMALALPSAKNGNLLIDEIESAIHISALGHAFSWLVDCCQRYHVQLIATTHSLEALDAILAASKDRLSDMVGYRFPAPEQGGQPKRYAGDQLSRIRFERGLDVR